jgi:hypothetical protein
MTLPSSSAASAAISLGFLLVTEKLSRNNHQMWKAQVLSALRGAQVASYIDPVVQPPPLFLPLKDDKKEEEPPIANPEFAQWVAKDQQVMSYLLTSLSWRDRFPGLDGGDCISGVNRHRRDVRVPIRNPRHQH